MAESQAHEAALRLWQALNAILGNHGCEWKGMPAPKSKNGEVYCQFCGKEFRWHHPDCVWKLASKVLEYYRDKI